MTNEERKCMEEAAKNTPKEMLEFNRTIKEFHETSDVNEAATLLDTKRWLIVNIYYPKPDEGPWYVLARIV